MGATQGDVGIVAAYARISKDDEGEAAGVSRQLADCATLARLRGWPEPVPYPENDTSAYRGVRPVFDSLLVDIAAGKVRALIVYAFDRLARQPRDLERLLDVLDARERAGKPVAFASVTESTVDLGSAAGRTMARIVTAMANQSSADTSRRVAREAADRARAGMPGGGPRPFGWQANRITVDEAEAKIIREAVRVVLGGGTLADATRVFQESGATSSRGARWGRSTVRSVLTSPRLAGIALFHREALTDDEGAYVKAAWEPIISEAEHRALTAVLAVKTGSRGPGYRARKYVLSGLLRCGQCHGGMRGQPRPREAYRYICVTDSGTGCGRMSITGPQTEEYVIGAALERTPRFIEFMEYPWEEQAAYERAEQELGGLRSGFRDNTVSAQTFYATLPGLEQRARDGGRTLARAEADYERRKASADARTAWPTWTLSERRAVLDGLLVAVVVNKATRPRWSADRLTLVWRESA